MAQRKYFEIFACAGRTSAVDKDFPQSFDTLLDDMSYARIHGAAFIHNGAKDYSFQYGNQEALKTAKNNMRLNALAVTPATAPLECGNENYFTDLLRAEVCGFVLLNRSPLCPILDPKSMEKMANALISYNRPLIIHDSNCEERYAKTSILAKAYPELKIIMQGTHWATGRMFWDVIEHNPNVYFDISSNHTNRILELTKKHFGIERALYSSAWPVKSMGAMKSLIEYADISDDDKDLVAHKNACNLFGLSPDDLQLYEEHKCQFDEIAKEADQGKPLSIHVIDAHTHTVANNEAINNNIMLYSDPKAVLEKMNRLGVDTTITAPWTGIFYDGAQGNAQTLMAAQKYPGKFLGFSTCNVNYEEELKIAEEYHKKYPDIFVGIKPYPPAQKFSLKDDVCKSWFEFANKHHLIALIHTGNPEYSDQADAISDLYPNITFILAHSGANYTIARKNAEIARKHSNIVLDITYTSTSRGMIEFLVKEVGSDRIIYGSDTPMRDPAPQLGWVCYAKISLEDKKKIFAQNINHIIDKRK